LAPCRWFVVVDALITVFGVTTAPLLLCAALDIAAGLLVIRSFMDCALVMSVIAKPDNRDLSVSEVPFNYNAHLDIKKLRIGYLKDGFEEVRDAATKAMNQKAIDQVQSLGVKLVEVKMPDWSVDGSAYAVESAVFFDEMIRTNLDKKMTNPGRATTFRTARFIPAVEYLQSQRARMMMMMKLAEATADVDVYLVPGEWRRRRGSWSRSRGGSWCCGDNSCSGGGWCSSRGRRWGSKYQRNPAAFRDGEYGVLSGD